MFPGYEDKVFTHRGRQGDGVSQLSAMRVCGSRDPIRGETEELVATISRLLHRTSGETVKETVYLGKGFEYVLQKACIHFDILCVF